jgi:glycosyltransferase involved in cell wall biosynthesis
MTGEGPSGDRVFTLLHFFPSFAIGGQQRRLAALVGILGPSFRHRILALDGDTGASVLLDAPEERVQVEPLALDKSKFVSLRNIKRLRRVILGANADLLCTYNFGSIEAAIANRLSRNLPHVHHEDGFGADEAGSRRKKRRAVARRLVLDGSTVVVPSMTLERIAVDEWRLDPERVRRIAVGIDAARFRCAAPPAAPPVIVGTLGALRREKNIARLIRCFEAAIEGRDAQLLIYGEGPERAALEAQIRSSRSPGRIRLAGATSSPQGALAQFHIFALSSDTEQTPTSLMEAMAAGLPAVATDAGDIRRMVGERQAAFVIAPENEADFSGKLRLLIDDAPLRGRLGALNAARATDFGQSAMAEAFRRLYVDAIGAAA